MLKKTWGKDMGQKPWFASKKRQEKKKWERKAKKTHIQMT